MDVQAFLQGYNESNLEKRALIEKLIPELKKHPHLLTGIETGLVAGPAAGAYGYLSAEREKESPWKKALQYGLLGGAAGGLGGYFGSKMMESSTI